MTPFWINWLNALLTSRLSCGECPIRAFVHFPEVFFTARDSHRFRSPRSFIRQGGGLVEKHPAASRCPYRRYSTVQRSLSVLHCYFHALVAYRFSCSVKHGCASSLGNDRRPQSAPAEALPCRRSTRSRPPARPELPRQERGREGDTMGEG